YSLQQEVDRSDLLGYEGYLLAHREVEQASLVWQQAAKLSDIEAYQPSPENLLVNGDFSLDILNGGFDWIHQPISGVSVALDTSETHSSSRSLRIVLEGPAISDCGISQLVRSEEHTSELQSPCNLVCRLLLEKKKNLDFSYFTFNFLTTNNTVSDS